MLILGIESSCDETAAAVVEYDGKFNIKSNIIASQIEKHKIFGGVVPEIASRMHIESISGVVKNAISEAGVGLSDLDGICVTYAPGLIGALLVGSNYAKSLSFALSKPLAAVHHIEGHICALFAENHDLKPPFVCLVASGGHSSVVLVEDYTDYKILAVTRDDAPGEAFDKISRVLGLGYPGGPAISKIAEEGDKNAFSFPRVEFSDSFDFSFSGVKTSVINTVHKLEQAKKPIPKADIAASFQEDVCEVLSDRLIKCARSAGVSTVAIAGGVASNSVLRQKITEKVEANGMKFYRPSPILCTDNAVMIAIRGYFSLIKGEVAKTDLNALASKEISVKNSSELNK